MIKIEETKNTKISAKGTLKEITSAGFILENEDGDKEVLKFADMLGLVGKLVTIAVANKEIVEE